jgi:hypothetical protein
MLLLVTFGGGFLLYLYYLLDQAGFNSNMYNIYFASVNTYHYYAIRFEELFEYYNNLSIQDQRRETSQESNMIGSTQSPINENQVVYSYIPYNTDNTLSYYNFIPNINMIDISKNPILFLKSYVDDSYKYLQFNDISLNLNKFLPIKPIKNGLFIQIELFHNGKTYDISLNSIAPFLVNNNYLFNKKFTQWFAQKHFNIKVEDKYIFKIIDESINMFEINENEYLYLENDTYSINKKK